MNFHSKYLQENDLHLLKQHFDVMTFVHDFQIVFENQIPQVAMVLLEGAIHIKSKNKIIKVIDPGILLGAYHLLFNRPVDFGCVISAKSEVLLIYKSELLKISSGPSIDPRKLILSV